MINDYSDALLMDGEPPPVETDSFTIAVLPDTQKYAAADPAVFVAQSEWIVENRRARNIACALHLGDITAHNTSDDWDLAVRALQRLDDKVPYFMTLGNHDYSENGVCSDRTTHFNEYFPMARYGRLSNFGGS